LIVFVDGLNDIPFILSGEVQGLFPYPSAFLSVFIKKLLVGSYSHFIIGETEDESKNEELLAEREHTIVDNTVSRE
jgi:hypothetical protein